MCVACVCGVYMFVYNVCKYVFLYVHIRIHVATCFYVCMYVHDVCLYVFIQ